MTNTTHEIELEPLSEAIGGRALLTNALPFLGSVKVQVSVRVGGADVSVTELLDMQEGGVLGLDRLVDEPLDVLVDGHVVARGMLVAVGDHFGVRITEAPAAGAPAAGAPIVRAPPAEVPTARAPTANEAPAAK
jgi:flagellar motor switch protein FliN